MRSAPSEAPSSPYSSKKKSSPWDNTPPAEAQKPPSDRKSTRLNSSHSQTSYAVFCLKKKNYLMHRYHDVISSYQCKTSSDADILQLFHMRSNILVYGSDFVISVHTSLRPSIPHVQQT